MASRDSLGEQFNLVVSKRIRQISYKKTLVLMKCVCHDILASFTANAKFFDVTGNTITSASVGVFYKGKRVYAEYNADKMKEPTRPTLRKNESYNLPEYYTPSSSPEDGSRAYVGEYGHGGQWGPTLGKSRMSRAKTRARDTWNIVFICPVEYASFNGKIFESIYSAYEDMPNLFNINVLYVRSKNIRSI